MEQQHPPLQLSVADCKNLLYYLEPHEQTEVVTAYSPAPYDSIRKICNYCRQRINNSKAASSDGFLFNDYYEENLL